MSAPFALPRLRIVAEVALFFAMLVAIDLRLTGGLAFTGVAPNPLWLPVLMFAMAYGTGVGVIAAALASAYWIYGARATVTDADYLDRLLHLSLPALMWFVAAGVVGEVTLSRVRRAGWLRRRGDAAQRDLSRLGVIVGDLSATNRALQVRLATERGNTGQIVAMAAGLSAIDPAARREAICALVTEASGTSDYTCYLSAPDGQARAWLRGAGATARPQALGEPLLGILRKRAEIVHVGRRRDRVPLQGLGVAALPLWREGHADMIGVLVFHDLPFRALDAYGLAALGEIGAWLAPLLGEALRIAPQAGGVGLVA